MYELFAKRMPEHHEAWLSAHPLVTLEWFNEMIAHGFHIHHIDHNRLNNSADNLLMIYGPDHSRLHRIEREKGRMVLMA